MDYLAIPYPDDLRAAIAARGETQRAFAARCGLSEPAISNFCNGLRPHPRTASKIAECLGLVVDGPVPVPVPAPAEEAV